MGDQGTLVSRAKASRAKRNFESSLQDLCLQTLARNEAIFTTKQGKSAVQHILSPPVRTRLLTELSRTVFDSLRYPAGKHRVNVACTLIHTGLEEFDFRVLGNKLSKMDNCRVWKCLADVAGQSLRTVRDERVTECASETRTLDWCLPHVARMPNLEQLQLTTLCCTSRDQLVVLAGVAPHLKRLQLHLLEECTTYYSSALHSLATLEELELNCHRLSNGRMHFNVEVPFELLSVMPQLKVNCFRADQLDPNPTFFWCDEPKSTWKGPFGLEHLALLTHASLKSENCSQLKNVKHVLILERGFLHGALLNCTRVFEQLGTINLNYYNFARTALPLLEINGSAITTLILDQEEDPRGVNHWMCLHSVLRRCQNLTSLTVRGAKVEYTRIGVYANLVHLSLRHLSLIDIETREGDWALHRALLSAPQLEQVHLEDICASVKTYNVVKRDIRNGVILSNLVSFKFLMYNANCSSRCGNKKVHQDSISSLAQAILCFCPKLQTAEVDLKLPKRKAEQLKQLVDIVNA